MWLSLGTVHEIDEIGGAVVIPYVSPGTYAKYLGGVSDTRDILKTDLLPGSWLAWVQSVQLHPQILRKDDFMP